MTAPLDGRCLALVLATSTGGVGAHVRSLVGALSRAGASVRVLGPQATEDLFGFRAAGGQFTAVEIPARPDPVRDLAAVRRLARATRGVDLVHAHGLRAGLVAVIAGRGRSAPVVVTLHNAVLDPPGLRRRLLGGLETVVARRATIVLAVSADLAAGALARGGRDVRFAPVAAPSLPPPTRLRAEVRESLGAADRPLVLAVGRLHEQKGHDVLVRASARWSARTPVPLVAIAGDGPEAGRLAALVADLRAPVTLLGRRDDVADLLDAADVVTLASRWEGWPLVAQEALRAGRPLVATQVGGTPQLVGDGGVLIRPGDVEALDAAVTRLLDDPVAAAALGLAAVARSALLPTESDTAAQVVAVHRELLGPPG